MPTVHPTICSSPHRRPRLRFDWLEDRTVPTGDTLAAATPETLAPGQDQPHYLAAPAIAGETQVLTPGVRVTGAIPQGGPPVEYALRLDTDGWFDATATGTNGFTPRLTLAIPTGVLVVADTSPTSAAVIRQHLPPGTYTLSVSGVGSAGGAFGLITEVVPANLGPTTPTGVGTQPDTAATGDFNHDGFMDLAVGAAADAGVSILLGIGDGTFRRQAFIPTGGLAPSGLVAADLDGDHNLDLAVCGPGLGILWGIGDGTFQPLASVPVSLQLDGIAAVDTNGDGRLDLVGVDSKAELLVVVRNHGGRKYTADMAMTTGTNAWRVVAADFNRDGIADLATAGSTDNTVAVFLGNPGGETFTHTPDVLVGGAPAALVVGDFDADGRPDLATANAASDDVSVLYGNGDGTFQDAGRLAVGSNPDHLVAADFDGDGRSDLVVGERYSNTLSVLLAGSGRVFGSAEHYGTFDMTDAVATADFDGDGRTDLAVTDAHSQQLGPGATDTALVLLGRGDGSFRDGGETRAGVGPTAMTTADMNRDGHTDTVIIDAYGTLSVLLSNGDGTLRLAAHYPLRDGVPGSLDALVYDNGYAVTTADMNGDGRNDVVATSLFDGTLIILLGLGDGQLLTRPDGRPRPQDVLTQESGLGFEPYAVAAGYFENSPQPQLAVSVANGVQLVRLDADGRIIVGAVTPVAGLPRGLVAADLNGDGATDLAVACGHSGEVAILYGRGDGTFTVATVRMFAGPDIRAIAVGDFDGDGRPDLAAASYADGTATVFRNQGGIWAKFGPYGVGSEPLGLVAIDLDGDGAADLAVADRDHSGGQTLAVLYGLGQGGGPQFEPVRFYGRIGAQSLHAVVTADLNGDGFPDLLGADFRYNVIPVLLGNGQRGFTDATGTFANEFRPSPVVADLTGDGISDVATVDAAGEILFRAGRPGGGFAPPRMVAAGLAALGPGPIAVDATRFVVHDLVLVHTDGSTRLAALPTGPGSVMLFSTDGQFTPAIGPDAGQLPSAFVATDIDHDGRDELVILDAGARVAKVFAGQVGGRFTQVDEIPTGDGPVTVVPIDLDGDRATDLAVIDQLSGQVLVALNDGRGHFAPPVPFRAGTAASTLENLDRAPVIRSGDRPGAAIVGPFGTGGGTAIIVAQSGTDRLTRLDATPGGLAVPLTDPAWITGRRPTAVVSANFDSGVTSGRESLGRDLAVLNRDDGTISVFLNDGRGGLRPWTTVTAGAFPVDLAVADVGGPAGRPDGIPDLVVGNIYGDVLVLVGRGDGTFSPARGVNSVTLDVAQGVDRSAAQVLLADRDRNQVSVLTRQGVSFTRVAQDTGDRNQALLAPGGVTWASLDATGTPSALVVSGGGNSLLVYTYGTGGLRLSATYPTGTNPVGMTVGDLSGDGIPDVVVANAGSNDLSVLFGSYGPDGGWVGTPGPRLRSGIGPNAVVIRDIDFRTMIGDPSRPALDGIPDLVVTNGQDGTISYLRGLGGGFFNDTRALALPISGGIPVVRSAIPTGGGARELFLTESGAVVSMNLAVPTAPVVLIGGGVAAFQPLPAGDMLVAGFRDGTVSVFRVTADGATAASLGDDQGLAITTLSDLAVASSGSAIDVYLTTQTQDMPFLVSFDLSWLLSPEVPIPDGGLTVTATSLGPDGGTLVATFLTGVGESPTQGGASPGSPLLPVRTGDVGSTEVLALPGLIDLLRIEDVYIDDGLVVGPGKQLLVVISGGADPAPGETPVEPPADLDRFLSGVDDALRELLKPKDPRPDPEPGADPVPEEQGVPRPDGEPPTGEPGREPTPDTSVEPPVPRPAPMDGAPVPGGKVEGGDLGTTDLGGLDVGGVWVEPAPEPKPGPATGPPSTPAPASPRVEESRETYERSTLGMVLAAAAGIWVGTRDTRRRHVHLSDRGDPAPSCYPT